ncbi:flavodoxin family protein [Neptunomonas qingdaonensis]|uniref:NADPH-dependent FMN reductase n=1 Tax=Neptunomonas qingdaonensis TaxID=1045558 RepID=A0A1I2V0M1_9GAMM|nr:flavodoxin family protein [Neptunomonas qingdaonensis]SFG80741.1 NADPH-dependent FMN reductase [Neptunomonas qingdaonensis]
MPKILVINGSYRSGGITDQTLDVMVPALKAEGAVVDRVDLRDYPIEFCLNCRECTKKKGNNPGKCVQQDAMQALVDKIEMADAYVLASPTNFGSVTAVFKRFMERLIVYAYWPWDQNAPVFRKADLLPKKAILVSSCAAPGILGRWLNGTHKQLKTTAKVIGAHVVGTLFTGLVAKQSTPQLSPQVKKKAEALALKLL